MFTISKEFHFSASHRLEGLPENHQCARLHGHNYVLVVELASDRLNEVGFVRDYGDLDAVKAVVEEWDHRHLNDLVGFNPTSEELCAYLFGLLVGSIPELSAVRLSETPKTWCEYRP